ncbi:hypothetical protein H0H93_003831 [Arthromyces matolae]|nr:hypothetical protein H0H93_003831 [Arthromyces matolae]
MSVDAGSSQRVLVSLAAAPHVVSSEKWKQVQAALQAQLPLRNIHWKSGSQTSIRTIQELNVELVSLDTPRDEHTQIPLNILEKPLLNLYVVVCQNTDLEGYKNTVKRQIKDWHATTTMRKNQEWLILHIIRPDTRAPSGNFFQLKGSVLEKIKSDFNTEKKDRCIQVAWSPEIEAPAVWAEVVNKIKDGVLAAFDLALIQKQEEVQRSQSQREMPGWNFCNFFILKESLASSFEGVTLFEDAYTQYEELETLFFHVLKEDNLSWFGKLITPAAGDDSAPLLSVKRKPYRDLILRNAISIFDFRVYLLSRQSELLARRGRLSEICRKVATFFGSLSRRLRMVEETLPQFFIESWIYSSSISVVDYCDYWATRFHITGPKLNAFNAAKGELLELARTQLDSIGTAVGHLPQRPPFSFSSRSSTTSGNTSSTFTISNTDIITSIDNAESFYKLYVDATNRAIELYTKAGRRKFALRLHASLAALDLQVAFFPRNHISHHSSSHRGNYENALSIYTSLPAHYAPHLWSSLEGYMLSRALDTHADYHQEKDTEWIHILLSFLKSYIDNLGLEVLIHQENQIEYISNLVESLQQAASNLDADIAHPDHPAVSLKVSSNARIAETKDGCFLDAAVGAGTFLLDSSELSIAKLHLQWQHRSLSSKTPLIRKENPVIVHIPRDLLALDVSISQPNKIELGEPPTLLVTVSTGRNHVVKASVKLAASGVTFLPKDARYTGGRRSRPLQVLDNIIILEEISEHSTVSFIIPHSDASAFQALKVTAEVEYTTVPEPSLRRTIRATRVVVTALPMTVNVEDFFRGSRLFSKFTISSTSHQHVRICAASLTTQDDLDGVKISATATKNRGVVTVTPAQPVNFLFHIDSKHGPEVEGVVDNIVTQVLADSTSPQQHRATLINQLVEALEGDATWVDLYGITGELKIPETPNNQMQEETAKLLDKAKQLLVSHRHPYPPEGNWREIRIPVDVPYMNIVASARIHILSTPFSDLSANSDSLPLYAGQPLSAMLSIHTSFHWGSSAGDKERRYTLRYDVEEMVRDWLLSGPKRGDFAAGDGETKSVPITLIALHHGELALPKVSVKALPVAGELTMGSMGVPSIETFQIHGAETVLVLPRGGRSTFVIGMGSNPH